MNEPSHPIVASLTEMIDALIEEKMYKPTERITVLDHDLVDLECDLHAVEARAEELNARLKIIETGLAFGTLAPTRHNARLIAAAPVLLATLQELRRHLIGPHFTDARALLASLEEQE
jgi:hypothetical protein